MHTDKKLQVGIEGETNSAGTRHFQFHPGCVFPFHQTESFSIITTTHVGKDFDEFRVDGRIEGQHRRYHLVDPVALLYAALVTETGAADHQRPWKTVVNQFVRSIDARVLEHNGNNWGINRAVGRAKLRPALANVDTLQLQGSREVDSVLPVVWVVAIGCRSGS